MWTLLGGVFRLLKIASSFHTSTSLGEQALQPFEPGL